MNSLTKLFTKNIVKYTFINNRALLFKNNAKLFANDAIKKKEKLEEENYVNRQERELMKKLLKKIKSEHNPTHESDEVNELKSLLKKHKIEPTEILIEDIKKWRDDNH